MSKKIQIFLRHCYYSKLQELSDRKRPLWFNKYKVFQNFKNTIDPKLVNYHIIYDEFYGPINKTFLKNEKDVKIIKCGNETDSFIETINYAKSKNYSLDTIVYFLEDDYLHRPGWCNILLEGFTLNPSYVTLYDFNFFLNKEIFTRIFTTNSIHWRSVPATTNTFSCKFSTFLEDFNIHKEYSMNDPEEKDGFRFSKDCEKFWKLSQEHNKYIISPIPGYSTHCHDKHLSPFTNWKEILNKDYSEKNKKIKIYYNYE
jgi:hypothetical protein